MKKAIELSLSYSAVTWWLADTSVLLLCNAFTAGAEFRRRRPWSVVRWGASLHVSGQQAVGISSAGDECAIRHGGSANSSVSASRVLANLCPVSCCSRRRRFLGKLNAARQLAAIVASQCARPETPGCAYTYCIHSGCLTPC